MLVVVTIIARRRGYRECLAGDPPAQAGRRVVIQRIKRSNSGSMFDTESTAHRARSKPARCSRRVRRTGADLISLKMWGPTPGAGPTCTNTPASMAKNPTRSLSLTTTGGGRASADTVSWSNTRVGQTISLWADLLVQARSEPMEADLGSVRTRGPPIKPA